MENNPYKNLTLRRTFIRNEDCIIYLLKLKTGNLITCSQDKEINIFEKNTFNLLLSWTGHFNSINCICELDDSRLVACSDDKRISIWKYDISSKKVKQEIIFVAHNSFINKVICLNDGNFASCSEDKFIHIWYPNPPYEKICTLSGHISEVTSMIQLKNNIIVSTSSKNNDGILKLWTLELIIAKDGKMEYDLIKEETMHDIFCHCINSLIDINDDKIAIGGYKIIRIVNVNTKQILLNIECHNSLISALTLMNDVCIVAASEEGNITIFNKVNYKFLKTVESAHDMIIFSLCCLDDNTLCSASKDGVIKVWNY